MAKHLLFLLLLLCFDFSLHAENTSKKEYKLADDPIDAIIVAHAKDKEILPYCINGIRENCSKVRRIIVVSSDKLTKKAEWFDEKRFPFSIKDVELAIGRGSQKRSDDFFRQHNRGPGWYLQQLLKLYSPLVIPDISSNVLVIDADVIFLNHVEFLNSSHGGLFCLSQITPKPLYFQHAERLLPGYKRIYPEVYSVCHHMLFQRAILEDLFHTVEQHHGKSFWEAFCSCVSFTRKKGASEYEIYYNFALTHTDQVALRKLKWINSGRLDLIDKFKNEGYHFVAIQDYLRKKKTAIGKVGHD